MYCYQLLVTEWLLSAFVCINQGQYMPWCTWRRDANEALDPQLWYITCVPLGQAILGAGAMEKKILFMDLNGGWCHNTSCFFRCTLIISDKPSLHGWVAHNCSRFTASGLWAPHSLLSFGARSNWPRTQRSNKHHRSFPRFCWTKKQHINQSNTEEKGVPCTAKFSLATLSEKSAFAGRNP